MKKTILRASLSAALLWLCAGDAYSQQTFNVSGHSAKIDGMTFDYSIGEMTLVSTERNAHLIVTQGLLQPSGQQQSTADAPGAGGIGQWADLVSVYPNPTQHILYIETRDEVAGAFALTLHDGAGRMVLQRDGESRPGTNRIELDLKPYAAGTYYLLLRKPGADGQAAQVSFKVQKVD